MKYYTLKSPLMKMSPSPIDYDQALKFIRLGDIIRTYQTCGMPVPYGMCETLDAVESNLG